MPRSYLHIFLAVFALAAWSAVPAGAAESPEQARRLERVEKALVQGQHEHERLQHEAQTLSDDLATVKEGLVTAATAVQEQEDYLTNFEKKLADLQGREAEIRDSLNRRHDQTIRVLMALERLAWRPTDALIAQPMNPAATVRSAILLRAAIPSIEASAENMRREIVALGTLRAQIATQRNHITASSNRKTQEAARLKDLFERKISLQRDTEARSREVAQEVRVLAHEATTLRDLMARIEEERLKRVEIEQQEEERQRKVEERQRQAEERQRQDEKRRLAKAPPPRPVVPNQAKMVPEGEETKDSAESQVAVIDAHPQTAHKSPSPPSPSRAHSAKPFSKARGLLPMPARGSIIITYGQVNDVGLASKGITIRTRSGAQIVAPYDGVVVFSGLFRGYGQLLIIEHGEGYHTLLSGMTRIDTEVGQRLLAGEPVGVVETLGDPTLYVELRREGQPINPLPWLMAQKGGNRG